MSMLDNVWPTIRVRGSHLEVNVDMQSRAGQLLVAVRNAATGGIVPGFSCKDVDSIIHGGVHVQVKWKGVPDLKILHYQSIRLEFHFIHATLHAFQFLE